MAVIYWLVCLVCTVGCSSQDQVSVDVDFERAMGKGSSEWDSLMQQPGSKARIEKLKIVFDRVKSVQCTSARAPKIPKIIHQIWLGPKSPPSYFWEYKKHWQERHPDWEYHLWQDKDVEALDFELKDLFKRSTNWGEKADILRAELLDRYGGLYIDVDFDNLKPFDELHEKYDFYAGLEPPHQGDLTLVAPNVVISNALVGVAPGHPIIKGWKARIREHWDAVEAKYPDGAKRVLLRTFYPFGEAVMQAIGDDSRTNIVFPATYFYPLTFSEVSKGRLKKMSFFKRQLQAVSNFFGKKNRGPFVELQQESMAVHYWGNSWVKSYEERIREMYRHMMQMESHMAEMQNKIFTLQAQVEKLELEKTA